MTWRLFRTVLPPLGYGVIRLLGWSMRLATRHRERVETLWRGGQNVIIAFWHGRGLLLSFAVREGARQGRRIHLLVSQHRDGEVIARAITYFGGSTVRGSSTRGGSEALRQMVQLARGGADLAITPDGPVGPSGTVHPGVIEVARITGLPIIPLSVGVSRGWHLGSWDRFLVPAPFSRGLFIWGEPIWVTREADAAVLEQKRLELKAALDRMTEEADRGEVLERVGAYVSPV